MNTRLFLYARLNFAEPNLANRNFTMPSNCRVFTFRSRKSMRSTFTQVSASTDFRMLPGFHALSALATALSRKRSAAVYSPCSVISPSTSQVIGEGILPEFSNYNPAWTYVTLGASDTKPFAQLSNVQSAQAWHVARRLWYWQANGQQRITLVLDQGGWATPRATDMLW